MKKTKPHVTRFQELGIFLREARKARSLTQQSVSDALSYSSSQFVSNFERGIAMPPLGALRIMIKLYNLKKSEVILLAEEAYRREISSKLGS